MGKTIYILSCTSKKAEGEHPVRELYIGQLFKKGLSYAMRQKPDRILVFGGTDENCVFDLHDTIKLDRSFYLPKMPKSFRMDFAKKRLTALISKGVDTANDTFIFLTGKAYYEFLLADRPEALPNAIVKYKTPFSQNYLEGIGKILQWLDNN